MEYLNEADGYITVSCEKCDQIIKKHKSYCKQYGDEYYFNPEITCSCGNTESVAYKKVMDNPSNSQVDDNKIMEARQQLTSTLTQLNINLQEYVKKDITLSGESVAAIIHGNINPEIICLCGNMESVAYKKVMDNPDAFASFSSPKSAQEIGRELLKAHINSLSFTEKIVLHASSVKLGASIDELKEGIVRRLPGYKMGKYEGKKEGYTKASKEYEDKLIKQASRFEEQKVLLKENQEELKELIENYEIYIKEQKANFEQLSEEQQKRFEEIKIHYEKLLKIK